MLGEHAPTNNYATIDVEEDSDATESSDTDPDSTT